MADELPDALASVLSQSDADSLRQKLLQLPEPPPGPSLTKDDTLRALAICLWVFVSTFPVVVPFLFIAEVQPALRLSNAIAIAMLFVCGYAFARCTGLRRVADRAADGCDRLRDGRRCYRPRRLSRLSKRKAVESLPRRRHREADRV